MTDIISLAIIYLFGCYILYLIGVLISRLWLIFIIPILIFLIACMYTKIWNNLNIYNFFGDVVPVMCLVIPSVTKTFQGIILPLNPIKGFFLLKEWFDLVNYRAKIKREEESERKRQAKAERKNQENLNEQFSHTNEQAKQRQQDKARAEQAEQDRKKRLEQEARRAREQAEKPHKPTASEKLQEAYFILGVSSDMSMAEIKKAYYTQYKKCDPSRINDMNEELVKYANEMAKKLNWAIDVVKKEKFE